MWVMPSSSARCAQLPRAADKVPYYAALKKFRDYLNGTITHLDESDIVFADSKLKKKDPEAIEDKKHLYCDDLPDGDNRITEINGTGVKQDTGLQIPGKKKRGRPKKIKNPDEQPPPDLEKLDANGEVIKKRRGRPKKIHQQQKQLERDNREREQQQQQHQTMGHLNDGYGNAVPNCFSPPLMSPPKTFAHMAPYPQPMGDSGFFGQAMNDNSPYNMSAKQSPVHLQHYSQSPKSMSLSFTHSDLSSEINTAISSENNLEPSPLTSPSVEHPDFEPPSSISQQNIGNDHRQYNPAGGPDPATGHHGSPGTPHNSYANYMGYHEPETHNPHPHQTTPTPLSQGGDEHSHHPHQTPPHTHPHTPTHMSPHHHPHEQYGIKRNSGQDVASKSLSDLESLVDQIPSIADNGNQRLQHSHSGMPDDLAEKMEAHHQSYMSGFGGMPAAGMTNYSPPLPPGGGIYPSPLHHSPSDGYGNLYGMNGRHQQESQQQHQQQQQQQQHSKSYTVENLTSNNYTPSMNHPGHPGNSYSNIIPGPHYAMPMGSTNGYLFSGLESSLMQRTYGIGGMSSMSGIHPSLGHMANPYPYNGSYTSSFDSYPAPPAGIHAPSANYAGYVGTGGAAPSATTPPSYLPSHHRPPVDLSYDGV